MQTGGHAGAQIAADGRRPDQQDIRRIAAHRRAQRLGVVLGGVDMKGRVVDHHDAVRAMRDQL